KYQEAIACFDRAIEIDPRYADAWYMKGLALGPLGKYQEAIEAFENVIKFAPSHDRAQNAKEFIQVLNNIENKKSNS
ncbi:MAG: tetratricopeptide repeat protein, partial [Patescibacteria group bacterium]